MHRVNINSWVYTGTKKITFVFVFGCGFFVFLLGYEGEGWLVIFVI